VRRRRGASILEGLVAFSVAATVLILLLNLFPSSMATVRSTEHRTQAAAWAASVLESRAGLPFGKLEVDSVEDLRKQTHGEIEYKARFDVRAVPGEDARYLRALRVTVTWEERNRQRHVTRELWVHRLPSRL
jgi:hypothetical protein